MFGCISKNVSKNIFWCLVVFLKIPQKTHFLLVAHIFSVAKRIYNIIHSSIQKHKQNPEKKKNHQIQSHFLTFSRLPNKYIILFILQYRNTNKTQKKKSLNSVKLREEGRERGNWVRRGAAIGTKARSRSARCFARSRSREASVKARLRSTRCFAIKIAIDASRDRDRHGASRDCVDASCDCDRRGASRDRDRREGEITIDDRSFSLYAYVSRSFSLFLPLRVCELLSLRVSVPEVI